MFIQRSIYDGYILSALDNVDGLQLETIQIKDFIKDEKMLIGRVDAFGNPILLNPLYVKSFASKIGGSQVKAVNFVVDAFKDMQEEFEAALRVGKVSTNSQALDSLAPVKGYMDPSVSYADYRKKLVDFFRDYVFRTKRLKHIRDFETFVPIFMDFATQITAINPITETMYILTSKNSVLSSGLAIEIYNGDYNDDALKLDLFYQGVNFEYLKNLAYGHGFVIDKHIPWRFVADINSPQMAPYVQNATLLPEAGAGAVLEFLYTRPHLDDLNNIASLMVECYSNIVRLRPRAVIKTSSATASTRSAKTTFTKCAKKEAFTRRVVSLQDLASLPLSYWIDKYVKIRNIETGLHYDEATANIITRNAVDLANSLDTQTSTRYIATKFDNFEHFRGSLFHDLTRIQMSSDPNATGDLVDERVQRSVQASNFVVY